MYHYPDSISDDIIELMCKEDRIYKYVDIPIQHINDEILKMMGRSTSKNEIKKL